MIKIQPKVLKNSSVAAVHATTDQQLIDTWLRRSNSVHTRRKYRRIADNLLLYINRPLRQIRLEDLQDYQESLKDRAPATQAGTMAVIKSLLSFGHEVGYLTFNIGKGINPPKVRRRLSQRILPEADILRMIHMEDKLRNRLILLVGYAGGLRVSELVALTWKDVIVRSDGLVQLSIFGKGGECREVLLPTSVSSELLSIREETSDEFPVFASQKKGDKQGRHPYAMTERAVLNVIKRSARRSGLSSQVSTYWLRHAHASHSLDRGATVATVKQTLGHANIATTSMYLHARPENSSGLHLAV